MLGSMALLDDIDRVAQAALALAEQGEELAGIVTAEPQEGERTYLCAFSNGDERTWVVLDDAEAPVTDREAVRRAATIAAMCELADESAGGGELDELRERLMTIRLTESPEGIEEAEEAALALQQVIGAPPRVAEPGYLDRVGAATRRLELALGDPGLPPFAEAMKAGMAAVEQFAADVETHSQRPLD